MDVDNEDRDRSEERFVLALDQFLLFGKTRRGERALDTLRRKAHVSTEEQLMLDEWKAHAFFSLFQIDAVDDAVHLFDCASEAMYAVQLNTDAAEHRAALASHRGSLLMTSIAPTCGTWFLSGVQTCVPRDAETAMVRNFLSGVSDDARYRNNPERLARDRAAQQRQYDWFVRHHGRDEVIVAGADLAAHERASYAAYAAAHGQPAPNFAIELPEDITSAETVGILIDPHAGQHYCREYGAFVDAFARSDAPRARRMVTTYLRDPSIPAFVVARMRDRFPDAFRALMRAVAPRLRSVRDHGADFDALMDTLKPGWRTVYPSIHTMSDRVLRLMGTAPTTGRNDPCPCGSGKKYKKCCLR